jgi:hypoxanthine phosphoribosyltransferase
MTWGEFEKEIEKLAALITSPVDIIVPIARGGLIPGRILASKLHIKTMYALTVIKSGHQRHVVTEITQDITDKNILLVEDMLEIGTSMQMSKEYLEKKGANVLTACLYTMPQSKIVPEYSLKQITSVEFFPWE